MPLTVIEVSDHLVKPFATVWVRANAVLDGRPPPASASVHLVDEFRQMLADDARSWGLLAYDGPTPVGCVRATDARADQGTGDPIPGLAHLASLAVEPARWGTGAGSALLRAVERTASARGYEAVQLVVHAGNARARSLYRRAGWRETGDTLQVDGKRLIKYLLALPTHQ